jgi:hypothetical protein
MKKGAMILTSNRGFAEWCEVFGDPVVATALLDRLLHHAVVIQIEGSSYRMRQHAALVPRKPAVHRVRQSSARSETTRTPTREATRRSNQRLITHRIPQPPNKGILNAHFCGNFGAH